MARRGGKNQSKQHKSACASKKQSVSAASRTERLEQEEISLKVEECKVRRSQIRFAYLRQKRDNALLILRTVALYALAATGGLLLLALVICSIWFPEKFEGILVGFQTICGIASLVVGIWALLLSIKSEKNTSLSQKRFAAVNYSRIPSDVVARLGENDVNRND